MIIITVFFIVLIRGALILIMIMIIIAINIVDIVINISIPQYPYSAFLAAFRT